MATILAFVSGFVLGTFFVPYWGLLIKVIKYSYNYASGNNGQAGERQNPFNVAPGPNHTSENRPPDFRKL